MKKALKKIIQLIDSLALDTVMLDPGDIPGLGQTLKSLESIENLVRELEEESLISITYALANL